MHYTGEYINYGNYRNQVQPSLQAFKRAIRMMDLAKIMDGRCKCQACLS